MSRHEPDLLIEVEGGKIVVECKRKIGNKFVSATEAEEILGKGAKYNPIAKVTIGYPDFEDVAKQNADNTRITLITHVALAEMLLALWERKISKEKIIEILKSGKYVENISE